MVQQNLLEHIKSSTDIVSTNDSGSTTLSYAADGYHCNQANEDDTEL